MKNQYFGDTRDLFKYDLVLEILLKSPIKHFTFIPMLTPNEQSTNGGKINYSNAKAGILRVDLKEFIQKCIRENRRNIVEIERFFKNFKSPQFLQDSNRLTIYKKNEHFSDKIRKEYFEKIPKGLLLNSVILVDPDNGLEVKSAKGRGEKYIQYDEVKNLFDRMDKSSILIIFQFIPRVKREKYFPLISGKLKDFIPNSFVNYISDGQIVFFILVKDIGLQVVIEKILNKYSKIYELFFGKEESTWE